MRATDSSPILAGWRGRFATTLGVGHGLFYLVSGAWPLIHLPSFLYVTGPKTDLWLVQTVGSLLAVTGAALALAAYRRRLSPEWALVAGGQAGALAAVDVIFVSRSRISGIYLADAVVELALVALWIALALSVRRSAAAVSPVR